MTSSAAFFATLLASGLLGSFGHCIGMCGPLVTMMSLRIARSPQGYAAPVSTVPPLLLYHGARISVYAGLGAVGGAIGSLAGVGLQLSIAAACMGLVLGLSIILSGAVYLGWLPLAKASGSGTCLTGAMGRLLGPNGRRDAILLGGLNGLLPCGLVYSALLVASSSGGIGSGALGMLVFGVGTVPTLLFVGVGLKALSVGARRLLSNGAGFLILLTGLQLILRSAAALGIVPSFHIGGFVFW